MHSQSSAKSVQLNTGETCTYLDSGQGPITLVLLHAFPLDKSMWNAQVEALSPHARVLAPDLPGFGAAFQAANSDYGGTVAGMARYVASWMETVGLHQVVLGGLSMGGYVALELARHFPFYLQALILADTKAEPDDDAARAKRAEMIQLAQTEGPRAVGEKMLPNLVASESLTRDAKLGPLVLGLAGHQDAFGLERGLEALRDRADARTWLNTITVPTLVISGALDKITTPDVMAGLVHGIPDARQVIIEGAGHLANLEAPDEFNGHVQTFIKGLS